MATVSLQHFTADFPPVLCYNLPVAHKKGGFKIRTKSHKSLGIYLSEKYLQSVPKHYVRVFLFGCTQPDRNPATYLKGSLRCQWLRGHNWKNAKRYIARLCRRLEKRQSLGLFDYYSLGKLVHYTVDAFTSAHNDYFPSGLQNHREYEHRLHAYFTSYLQRNTMQISVRFDSLMEVIRSHHRQYAKLPVSIHTDSYYCVLVTSIMVYMLHTSFPPVIDRDFFCLNSPSFCINILAFSIFP